MNLIAIGGNLINTKYFNFYQIKSPQKNMENAESYYDISKDHFLLDYLNKVEEKTINLLVFGGTNSSGTVLKVCEKIESIDKKPLVFYTVPDQEIIPASAAKLTQHKIAFNVLQELARSGKLEKLIILSNKAFEKEVDKDTILGYYTSMNEAILSLVYYLLDSMASEMLAGEEMPIDTLYRIATIGIVRLDKELNETKYFNLPEAEKIHFFIRNPSLLFKNKNLIKNLQSKYENLSYSILNKAENEEYVLYLQSTKIIIQQQ